MPINPEEDWDDAEKVDQIANMVGIRISSNKNLVLIAMVNDEVVGGVYAAWEDDREIDPNSKEPIKNWQYDVVVHPKWQGYKQVGIKLIQAAEKERKQMDAMYGTTTYTKLWVTNPKLARVLQSRRYNFQLDADHGEGGAHLSKYD